ncbi:hypothetical protein JL720_13328 [Aureococcus anophagefferens]|nr:hypothetical protein JL720_13328 [Aureococcus anophagefferens]
MGSRIETTHRGRASIGGEKAAGEKGSLPARRLPMAMRTVITVACMVRTSASRSPPARGAAATRRASPKVLGATTRVDNLLGMNAIGNKGKLWTSLRRAYGRDRAAELMPLTYNLTDPADVALLKAEHAPTSRYVCKNVLKSRREGIRVYARDVLTVERRKVNVRAWLVVACDGRHRPTAYLYKDAKCLYATADYDEDADDDAARVTATMHATMHNRHKSANLPQTVAELGPAVADRGGSPETLFASMRRALGDVFGAAARSKICRAEAVGSQQARTMIFGVDFLFTGALKPLVIEVQVFPNLKAADAGDFALKQRLIADFNDLSAELHRGADVRDVPAGFVAVDATSSPRAGASVAPPGTPAQVVARAVPGAQLWRSLAGKYGRAAAATLTPATYVLTDPKDAALLAREFRSGDAYVRNGRGNRKGLRRARDRDAVLGARRAGYALVQAYEPSAFTTSKLPATVADLEARLGARDFGALFAKAAGALGAVFAALAPDALRGGAGPRAAVYAADLVVTASLAPRVLGVHAAPKESAVREDFGDFYR